MKSALFLILGLAVSGCATSKIESPDEPINASVALIGCTMNKRSLSDYEAYGFAGADEQLRFIPNAPIKRGEIFFYPVSPGKKKIFIRVLATADSGLPGLRDGVTYVDTTIEGGKAYLLKGSRSGETLTVWLEEQKSKSRVSNTRELRPQRNTPILITAP